jgi:ATP-dependent DNA helicase PIF1
MMQSHAYDLLRCGGNVFLTGEPGSGKTHTIRRYLAWLSERRIAFAVTASTGIAATHLGGMTVHGWSGIGIRTSLDAAAVTQLLANDNTRRRVRRAKVLVIDEVSMLSAATLDAVDVACRALRRDERAFGGLQVVLVGDFFQLPPVRDRRAAPDDPATEFAFASRAWREAQPTVCYLAEQHRQRDLDFTELLAALRERRLTADHRARLDGRREVTPHASAVHLYAHNDDVDRINTDALARLPGEPREFVMTTRGNASVAAALARECPSPAHLTLKRGAKVVFTRNDARGRWANGTLGVVAGFDPATGTPVVRTLRGESLLAEPFEWTVGSDGFVLAAVRQVPLRLAWALTVHKSQGMSLDAAHVDLSRAFEYGHGYVALSRVRTLAGLTLGGLNERALEVAPAVVAGDREFREASRVAEEALLGLDAAALAARHDAFVRASATPPTLPGTMARDAKGRRVARWVETVALLRQGVGVDEVARARGRTSGTIVEHLEAAVAEGALRGEEIAHLAPAESPLRGDVARALRELGADALGPVYARFEGRFSYDELRVARLLLRAPT